MSVRGVSRSQFVRTEYSQHSFDGTDYTLIGTTITSTDRRGRTARIEDTVAGDPIKTVEFTYDDANQLVDLARKADQGFFFNTEYAYDNAGRVTGIEHFRGGDAIAFTEYSYGYDKADRITVQTTKHDTNIAAFANLEEYRIENFYYDETGQLKSVGGINANPESFTYDENGNRTHSSANGTTVLGEHNRLEEDADWAYQYDNEGNLIRKTAKVGGEYTTYTWDHRNRLIRIEDFDSDDVQHRVIEYRYDAEDRLVSRMRKLFWTEVGPVAPGYEDPVFENYLNNGADRVLMFNTENDLERRYVHGPVSDELIFDEVFDSLGQETDFFAPAADHLSSVRAVLNIQETVYQAIDYNAFGQVTEIRDAAGNLVANYVLGGPPEGSPNLAALDTVFSIVGRPLDTDTSLSQNAARWYDPHSGRFISEDPIQEGANWYRYAGNDPINFRDPTGLSQAGNPLNNLFNGGFGGNVVRQENTSLRNLNTSLLASPTLNYNSYAGPVRDTVRRSTPVFTNSLSTSNLLNQLSTPSYVPTARELTNFGPAQSFRSIATSNPYATSKLPRTVEQFNRYDQATVTDSGGRTRTVVDFGGKLLAFDPKTGYETGELLNTIQGESGGTYQTFATPSVAQNLKILENPSTLTLGLQGAGGAGLVASKTLGQAALIAGREFAENAIDLAAEQLLGTSVPLFNPTRLRGGTPSVTLGAAHSAKSNIDDVVGSIHHNADVATELTRRAMARGRITNSPQAFGSRSHLYFERLNERLNRRLADKGSSFRVFAEEFRDASGDLTLRRAKGSIGVDVIVRNLKDTKVNTIFDLKTYNVNQIPVSTGRQGQFNARFGAFAEELYRLR